ncbi:MAG: serine hydrolase [Acidobacteriota bacterium]|nr:serine hydrolase [Acidobacteriota bacterium]
MKVNLLLILAVITLCFFRIEAQPPKVAQTGDLILEKGVAPHKGLDEVYRRFSEGYRKLDAASVAELYTETAAYLAPGSNVQTGRQEVLKNFSSFFDSVKNRNEKIEILFRILQREVDRNLAYDVGIYTLVSTSSKGESRRSTGKFVVVAKREKGNVWRFQVDGYSDLPNASSNNQKPQSQSNGTVQPGELQTIRRAIEAQYAKLAEAIKNKDFEAFQALRTADFSTVALNAGQQTPEEMAARARLLLDVIQPPIEVSFDILNLTPRNAETVVATIRQRFSRMQNIVGKVRPIETAVTQDETWVKTPDGWKLKFVENEKDLLRFIDGKRVEPGKPYDPNAPPYNPEISINQKDLENLLDPIFAERMEKLHIPGAVIAVVKDGKILFTKGYGIADVEKKIPVIADKTIFRIGSITKVFTALAVMQLADQGKINLSDDVNKYLKGVQVPNTFPQPVTFANLLTHTSSLDEISPGRRTSNESEIIPLGAFLKTRIVRQFAPGEIISYSTYNPALAAHTVEQITQMPFKTYLQQNVFEPLGMNRTSIAAVEKEYQQDLATGYEYAADKYQKLPFQWFHTYPAPDINSTATDMARFMIANLQYGAIDGKRILSEKAARDMQASHFRNHPRIPGWAYGFYEAEQHNLRFVEHGGSMDDGYSALLSLIPEKNTGLFIACNTESCAFGLSGAIKNAFLNRYFPAQTKPEIPQTKNPSPDTLKKFAGKYRPIIYCHTCPPNTSYFPEAFEVKVTEDGMLSFSNGRWKQIEPMLFVLADGERAGQVRFGFKENAKGEIGFMFQENYMVYEKVKQ